MDVFLIECLCFISMAFILDVGNCLQMEQQLCDSSCAASSHHSYKRGVRYTYRYSTAITTTLEGSQSGRNGLALDCAVDIDVISNCHLLMQIRNPQIKRVSPQKEHSVQRLKSLREWLERSRLKFSLREGKVTALCPQEGGQLWTLNIQRAILSMLQTSRTNTKQETVKETDVYGTCSSRYERRGPVLLKTRDIQQCQQDRLSHFWPHSSTLTDDTTVDNKLQCAQRHGLTVMEEVNCTEVVSLVTLSGSPGVVKTQTVSTLVLLRAQEGTPSGADTLGPGVLTDLQFEVEGAQGPVRARASTSLEASDTVRRLCSLTSDQRQLSELFLHLAFQLRDLSLTQLRGLWQDASFKCRNDWQPLMDALPACGSEECILLLTDLIRDREIEQDQAHSYLSTLGLIPHPTPHIIHSINALLEVPEVRSKALLAGSSLIHLLCLRSPCSHIPQVQSFLLTLENILETDCEEKEPAQLTEVLYALKAVGNAGLAASALTPHLARCVQSPSAALDLRLAAIQAFRRIPCRADRGPLLQLYRSLQEDGEVRIAAYQQLMHCPDEEVFQVVKKTLSRETSSQVGSFVWSHLTHILRTEDPLKQALMEVLPDDIISRDFEAEPWKYSSYFDYTTDSGFGVANIEGSLVFSPKSFVPRSLMANLTVYVHGRAFNLLEVDLRAENIEPFLKRIFGHQPTSSDKQQTNPDREEADSKERKRRRRTAEGDEDGINDRRKSNDDDDRESQGGTDCLSSMYHYLHQARAMFAVGKPEENRPRCWVGVKVFGNELTMLTCDDLYTQVKQLSLNLAGMAVKLLKGQEVQLNHRAVLLTEEMVLPSLSGLPIRLSINMTSLLSLRLKGSANYRDPAHFSLAGYIKPNAYVGLSARVGVEGALGAAGVEWAAELRTSSSLDGSIYLQDGQSLRVTLNTPEDLMEVISLSSRLFHTSGDHREEIKGPKSPVEKTTCTPPKTWSKMVGWQLCYNISYPMSPMGISLPPPGPAHLSLRFLKLDKGLHQYLLEASYSLIHQKDSWLPSEASLHLLMATPQSTIPRDISLDLGLSPQRLVLKLTHPQKTIYIQGQLDQVRNTQTIQLDLLIDSVHHYYIMGLIDTQTVQLEQRLQYHLEAKMSPDGRPMILSANVTRGLGKKTSLSVALKNVFKETASFSVVLERRMDEERRQYSVEAELLLPGVVGSRILGLMEQKGSRWSSAVRLKYGLREESRHLHQECYTSQILRTDRDANQTYSVRAEHEFYCSNTASVNHKVLLRHEESPSHTRSSLDISYGKHWDEINNKRRLLISQSFRNQSRHTLTSYALEFSFQLPEKQLNYKTQLLHSHLRQRGAESSTHLKVNYNDHKPLVAGLHWKDASKATLRKLEATFNMDTPWLYIYTTHKLSQPQRHTLQLTSELTARKWLNIRSLVLEGLYMASSKEREARLHLYTPALTYLKARGWGMMGKQGLKASCSMSSLWSPGLRGDFSLETTKHSHTLQMASTYGKHNLTLTAALNTLDKNLRKRLVMVKVVFSEPKSPPMELEFEVGVEELLKEKLMYQKRAMLLLRQPFQNFLQNLQIQETFTVDLHKGLYILESKASLPGNREAIHTLTLGYQQPHPFVCSSLTHPFSSHTIPADSEVCVTVSSNQTQREVQGRVRVGKKNKLTFLGQVQSNPLDSPQHGLRVKASLSQLFQLQLPSSVIMEGDVSWNTDINSGFDYLARGKVGLGRQLCQFSMQFNGSSDTVGLYSSLSHPFKSKIPKTLEAQATAALFDPDGRASSTLHVRADGKDRAVLEAQLAHSLQGGTTALGLHVNLTQSLLPSAAELFLNMSANISSHSLSMLGSYRQGREEMLAQVSGSLEHTPGLQVAVSGDLRHSLPSLTALPPALGLDGALGQSDTLTEGQLRVRVGEAVYSIELNHQEAPKDFQEAEEGTLGNELDGAHDWLCARAGEESLCLNISRKLRDQGRVRAQLSHASSWLHASGIPGNSSGQVSWTREESRLAVLAELQAGSEALTAEFEGGRRDLAASQWELYSRLQHKIEALVQRGLPSSVQANAHYKMEIQEVSAGLSIEVEDQRKVHILVAGGRSNSTADLALSLWQQLRLLKGLVPSSLQMNCTGGVAEDRLSAQCSGSVAGQPMEVRAFRSHRPHSRLCYSLVLASPNLNTQAKGCYSPTGQTELRANLTHSSRLLRFTLGLPFNSSLRLLLRPGPTRWALGLGLSAGPWRGDLSGGLRLEAAGLYGWHGLVQYGSPSVSHKAEVRGRLRVESRCHLWADVSGVWDSVSSSLVVSSRCGGLTRVAWVKVWDGDAAGQSRTSMTILGRAGSDGLKGSLGLQNNRDSLHCLLSLVLKNQKAELGWTLQHQWASFSPTIPEKVDVHGSVQLQDASLSGSTRLSLDSCSAQLEVNAAWAPQLSIRASLQHSLAALKDAGIPEDVVVSVLVGSSQAQVELESAACAILAHGTLRKGGGGGGEKRSWSLTVRQRCVALKTLLPPQFSMNASLLHAACSARLDTHLYTGSEEQGFLSLATSCHPHLSLKGSARHSLGALRTLGVPSRGALVLALSTEGRADVELGLELGPCYTWASAGEKGESEIRTDHSTWFVNVTHYCLALQDTVLPKSLVLQGLLSVAPCQLALSSVLRVDNHDLNLELGQSCRPPRLSGTLTHSFPSLRIRGLPLSTSMEASAPGGVGQTGALLIKAGPCHIRARGTMGPKGRTKWSWATESECPLLQTLGLPSQAHLNGSVGQDDLSVWTAAVDAGVEGERGSLRLTAGARPWLRLEGKLSHNLASLRTVPGEARLLVTGRAGALGYDTEAQLQVGRCGVGASGTVMTGQHLQGVLVYHNNCTVLQEWGSPGTMTASGSLVVNVTVLETQVSMAMDDKELQASMAVRTSEGQQEVSAQLNHSVPLLTRAGLPSNALMAMLSENHGNGSYHQLLHCSIGRQQLTEVLTVERTAAMASVKTYLNHTISYLRNRGVPENNRIQLEVGAGEGKSLTLQSQFGAQQAGLGVRVRALALTMELQGHLRHSWRWLQERGLPLTAEAFCSVRGPLPQMRSRARLSLDGHGLLASSLNISLAEGRLAMLFSLASPTSTSTGWQQSVDATLTAQLTGPLKSVLAEVRRGDKQLRLSGDLRGWGTHGGSREARVMLLHSLQGQASPALQVEAWGRLTDSQLRCSMAVNPKLSSSLALIVQGYHLKDSKELMVKVVQNIPELQPYLPVQLNARSQLNQSSSGVGALLELASGSRKLWALVDVAILEGGFRQAVELNHSFPQLKPRSVAVRTLYERGKWSHRLQHGTVYGGQEIRMAGLYSAPPHLELGDHSLSVQMAHVPRGSSLDVTLARSVQGSLDSVQLGWNRHGRLEQVKFMSSRNATSETSETRLELQQPFISTLSQLHIHTLSRSSAREQTSNLQTHLSWDSGVPMNVSLFLNKQWQNNSSKGQACGIFSPGLQAVVASPANIEGCVAVAQEGNSYSQNAVLKWGDRSVRQGLKYQRVPGGTDTLQLEAGADNVSPGPCSSHSLLAQVHTNLKDRLEHRLQLDLCPPHPSLVWSGDHRVNVGVELLYSQTRLSITGQPAYCSITLGLINSSNAHSTNLTLFAESTVGNWSAEVGGSALSSPLGPGVQIQARLDRSEQVWLRGALEGRCLQTAAGYHNAQGPDEDLSLAVCVEGRRRLTLKALRRKDGAEPVTLMAVILGIANHSLIFRARGCADDLWEVETKVHHLGSLLRVKLLERVQKLQHVLIVFRQQSRASKLLQELSAVPLRLTQRVEALLGQREGGVWGVWSSSHLRHTLADTLPRLLVLLEHISRLGQQELKRPLATLAGAYHDVTGQRMEAVWRGAVEVQTAKLMELLSPVLQSHQLRLLAQTGLVTLGTGLDLLSQQTAHWVEGRLAASLSGLRRRLASIYRLSPSQCSVSVTVPLPLPRGSWSRVGEAGLMEVLLEEGLLKPLQALSSVKPTAELYRLKRRIMDSPFGHQALLVADQFGVTFDGHLFELPTHCPLLLAHDIYDSSFTVLLNTENSLHTLVVASNNSTTTIHQNGQVKVNCHGIQTSYSDNGLVIKKDSNFVEVSNQDGMSVSCDSLFGVCSITLDGWLHGVSSGLLGTNDNEAGNDFTFPDGLQADNIADFVHSWQVRPECGGEPTLAEPCSKMESDPVSCNFLFSAPDSPLGSCFRVVDPAQFLKVCERSHCGSVLGPSRGPCSLAAAFVHICQRNYVPLELPVQCFAL